MRKQMTNEPVAYIRKTAGGTYLSLTPISNDYGAKTDKTLPLYTKEQLQPKVQMTQAEFDELEKSLINAQFDYSELKKTIEIVPNKKWFVKRKNKKQFLFTKGDKLNYVSGKDSAKHFDTKEQAEEWCNPLTEAVLLPVEGDE